MFRYLAYFKGTFKLKVLKDIKTKFLIYIVAECEYAAI